MVFCFIWLFWHADWFGWLTDLTDLLADGSLLNDCLIDWVTEWLSNWLTDRLIDWFADWLIDDWATDWFWLINWHFWLTDWLSERQTDWPTDWLIDQKIDEFNWLIKRLSDCLTDCLIDCFVSADGTCAGVVCALDAECVTTPSNARICECKAGFTGNGLECRGMQTWTIFLFWKRKDKSIPRKRQNLV